MVRCPKKCKKGREMFPYRTRFIRRAKTIHISEYKGNYYYLDGKFYDDQDLDDTESGHGPFEKIPEFLYAVKERGLNEVDAGVGDEEEVWNLIEGEEELPEALNAFWEKNKNVVMLDADEDTKIMLGEKK